MELRMPVPWVPFVLLSVCHQILPMTRPWPYWLADSQEEYVKSSKRLILNLSWKSGRLKVLGGWPPTSVVRRSPSHRAVLSFLAAFATIPGKNNKLKKWGASVRLITTSFYYWGIPPMLLSPSSSVKAQICARLLWTLVYLLKFDCLSGGSTSAHRGYGECTV